QQERRQEQQRRQQERRQEQQRRQQERRQEPQRQQGRRQEQALQVQRLLERGQEQRLLLFYRKQSKTVPTERPAGWNVSLLISL
ncbi:MAG: hypothetical protein K8F27_00270, partial [Sulfuricellaceae bacterium]|nr:hypothetical protein [Sulfuricellaceae bacterium]